MSEEIFSYWDAHTQAESDPQAKMKSWHTLGLWEFDEIDSFEVRLERKCEEERKKHTKSCKIRKMAALFTSFCTDNAFQLFIICQLPPRPLSSFTVPNPQYLYLRKNSSISIYSTENIADCMILVFKSQVR